ncbi:MAG: hypothetical protein PF904_10015 [Kiritimatiellae bacterium]|jgi:hypothetical protein|nr:hypothetical protein [Kiritimatiellia bacterium]
MKPTPFDKYWADKANWKWSCFYCCKDDLRVIVPKKPAWAGRTLNFAHTKSYWYLLWTFVLPFAPVLLLDKMDQTLWIILYLCIIIGVVVFYYVADVRAE